MIPKKLRPLHALAVGAVLISFGCVSTSSAPSHLAPERCRIDDRLPGTWRSARDSQVGPASMRFEFECDCTYRSRVRVLLQSLREAGAYWVDGESLFMTRATGAVTEWRFRVAEDRLWLEESEGELYEYRRVAPRSCDPSSGQGER